MIARYNIIHLRAIKQLFTTSSFKSDYKVRVRN